MTEMLLNLLDEDLDNWDLRQDAMKALETVLKEAGGFPNEIRDFINGLDLPPEPPDPKVRINEQKIVFHNKLIIHGKNSNFKCLFGVVQGKAMSYQMPPFTQWEKDWVKIGFLVFLKNIMLKLLRILPK